MSAETMPPPTNAPEPPRSRKQWPKGVQHPLRWDLGDLSSSERTFRKAIARGLTKNAGLHPSHADSQAMLAVGLRRIVLASRKLTPEQLANQCHVIAGAMRDLAAIQAQAYARPAHRGDLTAPMPPAPPAS